MVSESVRSADTATAIQRLKAVIEQKKREVQDEEVDGWLIRRPSMFDIDDHFGMLFAESRPGSAPLVLPQTNQELCVGVIDGEIRLEGYAGSLCANQFFVVRPKDQRTIIAVQHPTKISAFFFRGQDDEPAELAARSAA